MKNHVRFEHFKAKLHLPQQLVELEDLHDMLRFAELNHLRHVLCITFQDKPHFAFQHKGVMLLKQTLGFHTLDDAAEAAQKGFPSSADFYHSRELGCNTYADYLLVQNAGIHDEKAVRELKDKGFTEGFTQWQRFLEQDKTLPVLPAFQTVKELSDFAQANGASTFAQFKEALQAGFIKATEFAIAKEKGLLNATDYFAFMEGDFLTKEDFYVARQNGITTFNEYKKYGNLFIMEYEDTSFDQRLLLSIISQLDNGKGVPFQKLYNHFRTVEQEYALSGQSAVAFPKWFTRSMIDEKNFLDFLEQSPHIKKFGSYDSLTDAFQTIHIRNRAVVIDGSNVAYNSNAHRQAGTKFTPYYQNILYMVRFLKEKGFTDIRVISDASLFKKAEDKNLLPELKAECSAYEEAPSGTQADGFILSYVKAHRCLLMSNDQFKEWKLNDDWLDKNIDFYRIGFTLTGDKVVIPDLGKYGV